MALGELIRKSGTWIKNTSKKISEKCAIFYHQSSDRYNNLHNKFSPYIVKFFSDNKQNTTHAILVMAFMGWIPNAWALFTCSFVLYFALKPKKTIYGIKQFFNNIRHYIAQKFAPLHQFANLPQNQQTAHIQELYNQICNKFSQSTTYLSIAKFCLSFYLVIMSTMPFSLLMIYTLYRPWAEVHEAIYRQAQMMSTAAKAIYHNLSNVKKVILTIIATSFAVTLLNGLLFNGLFLALFDVGMFVLMTGLTLAGIGLVGRDLWRVIREIGIFNFATKNMGVFLGMIGGNRFAHYVYHGKMTGNLGPAYGAMNSSGFFSSLYSMFFNGNTYAQSNVYFSASPLGSFWNRIWSGFSGFWGNIFFSYDVSTYGYFYGTLGPTSYQLFLFMVIGGVVGHYIDKIISNFSKKAKAEIIETWENDPGGPFYSKTVKRLKIGLKFVDNYRFPFIVTSVMTSLFSVLQMPLYASFLQATASPLVAVLLIQATLLAPALIITKLYRLANTAYSNYLFKKEQNQEPSSVAPLSSAPDLPQGSIEEVQQQVAQQPSQVDKLAKILEEAAPQETSNDAIMEEASVPVVIVSALQPATPDVASDNDQIVVENLSLDKEAGQTPLQMKASA